MRTTLFTTLAILLIVSVSSCNSSKNRRTEDFDKGWRFNLGDVKDAQDTAFKDNSWRLLNLPHDWSIEGEFSDKNPASPGGGALPGGIGWYRKTFTLPASDKDKLAYIDFDGIYRNSEVWINNHYLGKRPYGYSSFRYELTPYLNYGEKKNVIAVKVDNSRQPNSRWYSGSGIYRNVWLELTGKIAVDHWGTYITSSDVSSQSATINIKTKIKNALESEQSVTLKTIIYDNNDNKVNSDDTTVVVLKMTTSEISQEIKITSPVLWSVDTPYLYKAVTQISDNIKLIDEYTTSFGIRYFNFDREKGFTLNGKPLKIRGVCDHHDLGCLGAAVNKRAIERQLEILKDMGCNGIRTSHNPPAPELLDLCDKMGFIVMDEAFDMWRRQKTQFDYAADFNQWHKQRS